MLSNFDLIYYFLESGIREFASYSLYLSDSVGEFKDTFQKSEEL